MLLDNNDFFNFSAKNNNIFSTNVKSILGRNIVLNYIQGMDFELKMFNFSETANDIASFYEGNKRAGTISKFYNNDVIKMILEEIQDMPTLKKYLYTRIFDLIEQDKINILQKIYDDNEKISSKVEAEENKYLFEKEKYTQAIKKIMKEKNCSEETAKIIYENKKLKEQFKKENSIQAKDSFQINTDFIDKLIKIPISPYPSAFITDMTSINPSSSGVSEFEISQDQDITKGTWEDIGDKPQIPENQEIYISDDEDISDEDMDDGFWN